MSDLLFFLAIATIIALVTVLYIAAVTLIERLRPRHDQGAHVWSHHITAAAIRALSVTPEGEKR